MLTKKTTETFFDIDGVDVRMKLRWKNLHLSNMIFLSARAVWLD